MSWKFLTVVGAWVASNAWAEPTVTTGGDCPGPMIIAVDNITPGACIGIAWGDPATSGESVWDGVCEGTVMGLDPLHYAFQVCDLDGDGSITFEPDIDEDACGTFFQILDMAICEPSAVSQIDTTDDYDAYYGGPECDGYGFWASPDYWGTDGACTGYTDTFPGSTWYSTPDYWEYEYYYAPTTACEDAGGIESWIADGYCDSLNNNAECEWDGGDCCEDTCVDATYDCDTYGGCEGECLDPDGSDDDCDTTTIDPAYSDYTWWYEDYYGIWTTPDYDDYTVYDYYPYGTYWDLYYGTTDPYTTTGPDCTTSTTPFEYDPYTSPYGGGGVYGDYPYYGYFYWTILIYDPDAYDTAGTEDCTTTDSTFPGSTLYSTPDYWVEGYGDYTVYDYYPYGTYWDLYYGTTDPDTTLTEDCSTSTTSPVYDIYDYYPVYGTGYFWWGYTSTVYEDRPYYPVYDFTDYYSPDGVLYTTPDVVTATAYEVYPYHGYVYWGPHHYDAYEDDGTWPGYYPYYGAGYADYTDLYDADTAWTGGGCLWLSTCTSDELEFYYYPYEYSAWSYDTRYTAEEIEVPTTLLYGCGFWVADYYAWAGPEIGSWTYFGYYDCDYLAYGADVYDTHDGDDCDTTTPYDPATDPDTDPYTTTLVTDPVWYTDTTSPTDEPYYHLYALYYGTTDLEDYYYWASEYYIGLFDYYYEVYGLYPSYGPGYPYYTDLYGPYSYDTYYTRSCIDYYTDAYPGVGPSWGSYVDGEYIWACFEYTATGVGGPVTAPYTDPYTTVLETDPIWYSDLYPGYYPYWSYDTRYATDCTYDYMYGGDDAGSEWGYPYPGSGYYPCGTYTYWYATSDYREYLYGSGPVTIPWTDPYTTTLVTDPVWYTYYDTYPYYGGAYPEYLGAYGGPLWGTTSTPDEPYYDLYDLYYGDDTEPTVYDYYPYGTYWDLYYGPDWSSWTYDYVYGDTGYTPYEYYVDYGYGYTFYADAYVYTYEPYTWTYDYLYGGWYEADGAYGYTYYGAYTYVPAETFYSWYPAGTGYTDCASGFGWYADPVVWGTCFAYSE